MFCSNLFFIPLIFAVVTQTVLPPLNVSDFLYLICLLHHLIDLSNFIRQRYIFVVIEIIIFLGC